MSERSYTLRPTLFSTSWLISITEIHEHDLTEATLDSFIDTADDSFIGVATIHAQKSVLKDLALSTRSSVLVIRLGSKTNQRNKVSRPVESRILCNTALKKLAFDAERVSTALYLDHGLLINGLIDVQSLGTKTRWSVDALLHAFRDANPNRKDLLQAFNDQEKSNAEERRVALRAWATWRTTRSERMEVVGCINTDSLSSSVLRALANVTRNVDRLRIMKPTKVKNDISNMYKLNTKGELTLSLTRFGTRVRSSEKQKLVVRSRGTNGEDRAFNARFKDVKGRELVVTLETNQPKFKKQLNLYTFGRDDPTPAETERTTIVLQVLQGSHTLFTLPLAQAVFIDGSSANLIPCTPLSSNDVVQNAHSHVGRPLNRSQTLAVQRTMSPLSKDFVCVVHGPPGTGKTTVIAAAVQTLMANVATNGRSVWLMAQSNVAVKNIAEKLASVQFWDFKILVSFDFHFDWHEHLYHRLDSMIIRSDDFARSRFETERALGGVKVILCTISMLSHPRLGTAGFTSLVPVDTVIIDEASQIEVSDYIPMISKFGKKIRKLVFIGDDKQLPPFGQDDIKELRSVFEIKRLRKNMVFLDTQYRMPVPIGDFLSRQMYDGHLKSVHSINATTSCRLVDVPHGQEVRAGNSWKNLAEADVAIRIARHLHNQQKSYRVITPYDGQRALLESLLKREKLPWEDKCFCVDSFQGNEEDYIIISVVRSDKIGFLSNSRRSNVMLSRCKKAMYIVTSRTYLSGKASDTLVGKLAQEWGPKGWTDVKKIVSGK